KFTEPAYVAHQTGPGTESTRLGGATRRVSSRTRPFGKSFPSYGTRLHTKRQTANMRPVLPDGRPQDTETGTFRIRHLLLSERLPGGTSREDYQATPRSTACSILERKVGQATSG